MKSKISLVAAPMAGFSNRSFRDIVRSKGADIAYGEMVSARALVYGNRKTFELIDIKNEDSPRIIQLFGSEPQYIEEAALIAKELSAEQIDLNMGCPVNKVIKNNEGAALMRNPKLAIDLVKAASKSGLPVSVKIRAGWSHEENNYIEFAKRMEIAGAAFIAIHSRTREQFYTGQANWQIIKQIKKTISIPVIGNGDIYRAEDALQMKKQTNCDAIMVGRGMLGNPWIFTDIKALFSGTHSLGKPNPSIVIEQALTHLYEHICRCQVLLCKRMGEDNEKVRKLGEILAVRAMRNHLGFYLKGMDKATDLRRKINILNNYEEISNLLNSYLNNQKYNLKYD